MEWKASFNRVGTALAKAPARPAVAEAKAESFFPRFLGSWSSLLIGLSRLHYNYAADVGDGLLSSSVMPPIQWMMRTFPEAQLVVQEGEGDDWETIHDHPLTQRVVTPNDAHDATTLWMMTVHDWCWFGESYWRIVPTVGGEAGQLWWMPPWSVEPQWPADGSMFISHYLYTPDSGRPMPLDVDEVVHFRHSFDPRNLRHGLPPLRSVLREIWSDDEASSWIGSLLRNMGVPGMVLSPDPAAQAIIGTEQIEVIKAYIKDRYTGENRGEPLAFGYPIRVERLSLNPREFDMNVVRNTTEERVCSALGVPSAIVGFHSGLESTKVGATLREFQAMAWQNGLIPVQRIMAAQLGRILLPRYERQPERFRLDWDYRRVQALQEDENAKAQRFATLVGSAIMRRGEARTALGLIADKSDDVYHLPFNIVEVGPGAKPVIPALPPASRNGNGNGQPAEADEGEEDEAGKAWSRKQSIDALIDAVLRQRQVARVSQPPRQLAQLVQRLTLEARGLEVAMIGDLTPVFARLGDVAAMVARQILEPKQWAEDAIDAARIEAGIRWLELHQMMEQAYQQSYRRVAMSTFTAVGEVLGLSTDIPDPIMRAIIQTGGRRAGLLDLEGRTREALFDALTEGRAAGEGVDALVRRIRDQIPAGPWRDAQTRARVISRTETIFAQRSSTLVRARDVDHIQHMMVFDGRLPTSDQECVPASTQILALGPQKGFRRWFEGDLIEITTRQGYFLAATCNHPVLTRHGWVLAGDLQEGMDIICCPEARRIAGIHVGHRTPDDDDMPTALKQCFNLPNVPVSTRPIGKSRRAGNLDGNGRHSQVNIVSTNRSLRLRALANIMEPLAQHLFIGTAELAFDLTHQGTLGQFVMASDHASCGKMSGRSSPFSFLNSQSSVHQSSRIGVGASHEAMTLKFFSQEALRDLKLVGCFLDGCSSGIEVPSRSDIECLVKRLVTISQQDIMPSQYSCDNRFADIENGRDLTKALTGFIQYDRLVRVNRQSFHGYVYNLQTEQGWYSANGIITHNCIDRNGMIVTLSEAEALSAIEHPNGTMSFAPVPSLLLEELRVRP